MRSFIFTTSDWASLYVEEMGVWMPVVLLHGFTLDNRMRDDQFEILAKKFRVIRYDIRWFGKSSLPVEWVTYSHVNDLKELLDSQGIKKTHLIGLSMWGRIGLEFVLTFWESVNKLVLIDSALGWYKNSHKTQKSFSVLKEIARNNSVDLAKEERLNNPLFEETNKQPKVAGKLKEIVSWYSGRHWLHKNSNKTLNISALDQLYAISSMTCVIVWEKDVQDFLNVSTIITNEVPSSELHIIPNVGHMANMEEPEVINEILLNFLSEK